MFRQDGNFSVCVWQDTRPVTFMSLCHNPAHTTLVSRRRVDGSIMNVECPVYIRDYNMYMGGVNREDQLRKYYHVADLRKELQTRGVQTQGMLKPQLLLTLTNILQGAQRVPTLLTLYPTQSLSSINLLKYEVLDCEPLHDLKGHLFNLLPEIPNLLPLPLGSECQQLDTTLPKQNVSGAFLRVAAFKLLIKLQNHSAHVDKFLLALVNTVVRISELIYLFDLKRTPKTILQLYNVTWYHHELFCHFLSNPKHQSRSHFL